MLIPCPWRVRRALVAVCLLGLGLSPLGAQTAAPDNCPAPVQPLGPAQVAEGLRSAPDRGFLWRLERDGRRSWLYGTLHVARAEWVVPGPRVRQALNNSDVLALELDLLDPQTLSELMAPPTEQELAGRAALTADQQQQVADLARAQCLPLAALAGKSPMMQLASLTVLAGRADGFYPELAIDLVLRGWAEARKIPVLGLESAQAQRALLESLGETVEEQRETLKEQLAELTTGHAREQLRKVANIWARGDLATLAGYPQWCACMDTPAQQRSMARLLDDRNLPLARRIAALHAGGQRVFAAIGALHMVGPSSVVNHLRDAGFTVVPVAFAP
ncbi:MAG: TraB/GumN family protein [Ramlibacter sp.]